MDAPINPHDPRHDPVRGRSSGASPTHNAPDPGRSDPFDTLADLFLGPPVRVEATSPAPLRLVGEAARVPEAPRPLPPRESRTHSMAGPHAESPASPVSIEGLVLGHLPVFASAWATQYAKHVALTADQPVAFLRFTGDRASLDVYLPGTSREPPVARAATLVDAIASAAQLAPRWIVRLPDACEPDLTDGAVDVLTLLTGADEAAVVACYRTLKSLSSVSAAPDAALPIAAPSNAPNPNPPPTGTGDTNAPRQWRVAIMGADPIKAGEAGNKVRRAAEAFLEASLEISACVARIGSFRSAHLFEGASTISWREAINIVRAAPHAPAPPPPPPQPTTPTPSPSTPIDQRPVAPRIEMRPIASDPARLESRPIPSPSQPSSPESHTSASNLPPLASHTHTDALIPGLTISTLRCPVCPSVAIATDARGQLHLIATSDAADPVASLLAAAAWARTHASLISRADASIRQPAEPTLHYLTTQPAADRSLLDTAIRVHALVRVGTQAAVLDLN